MTVDFAIASAPTRPLGSGWPQVDERYDFSGSVRAKIVIWADDACVSDTQAAAEAAEAAAR